MNSILKETCLSFKGKRIKNRSHVSVFQMKLTFGMEECAHFPVWLYTWNPEVDIHYLIQSSLPYFFKTGFLTKLKLTNLARLI